MPTEKPAKDRVAWGDLRVQEVWVVQHMVTAPRVPKVIGESVALVVMAPFTAEAVAAAVTTVAAAVAQTLTHAAPMPEAAVVDLPTPTQV